MVDLLYDCGKPLAVGGESAMVFRDEFDAVLVSIYG
jgi:hypothetical protein